MTIAIYLVAGALAPAIGLIAWAVAERIRKGPQR